MISETQYRTVLAGLGMALVGLLRGCSDATGPDPGNGTDAVATIEISPDHDTIEVGEDTQLNARTLNSQGQPVSASVTWESQDPTVAIARSTGSVLGKGVGETTITAEAEGHTARATITVVAPPIASVKVGPGTDTIDVGQTVRPEVIARDSAGRAIETDLEWTSRNPDVASVSEDGAITGNAVGTTTVWATAESGAQDSLQVKVRDIATDLAVEDMDFLPRGILTSDTTRAQIIITNPGGYVQTVEWRLQTDDGRTLASGATAAPAPGEQDTVMVDSLTGLSEGEYRAIGEVDPNQNLEDADRSNNRGDDWLRVRDRGFDIKLRFGDNVSEAYRDTARMAAEHWEEVVVGDLRDIDGSTLAETSCLPDGYNQTIDDVVITVRRDTSLSVSGVANPCSLRNDDQPDKTGTAISGQLSYNPSMNSGMLSTIIHEIGHVLGLVGNENMGGRAPEETPKIKVDGEWRYVGPFGVFTFRTHGGTTRYIPMLDTSHWANHIFDSQNIDTMASGAYQLIGPISVSALADLTYAVDMAAADDTPLDL